MVFQQVLKPRIKQYPKVLHFAQLISEVQMITQQIL